MAGDFSGREYTHPTMEIRTLEARERMKVAATFDGWRLAEGWTAGDRFRQQEAFDPTWSDENVFVAAEEDRILALLSILSRDLKILGYVIPAGGIGNLFTDPGSRRNSSSAPVMRCARGRSNWRWSFRERLRQRRRSSPSADGTPGVVNRRFFGWVPVDRPEATDLWAVPVVTSSNSCSSAPMTSARFSRSNRPTPPTPRVEAARPFVMMRSGALASRADALARLIVSLLEARKEDSLVAGEALGRSSSGALRSFLVLPTFDDIGLTVALEDHGIRSHPMDDVRASFRCVNLAGFASRLDVDLPPDEDGSAFLRRILSPDAMVFGPADRF